MISIKNLFSALWQQLPNDNLNWLKNALQDISSGTENNKAACDARLHFSAIARRKLGTSLLTDLPNKSQWQTDEATRVILLSSLLEVSAADTPKELIESAYQFCDEYEKIAIMKGLGLLDKKGELVDLALLNGRTNNLNLFAAIALNNSYPALNYDDRAFNQLILKALFLDLDISHITGLPQRLNPKLTALCFDLVKERILANRNPPGSVLSAINLSDLSAKDQEFLNSAVENP